MTMGLVQLEKWQDDMKQEFHAELFHKLERARCTNRELDCWSGRKLQQVLGFKDWRSFVSVVEKAKVFCKDAGFLMRDHFSFGTRPMKISKNRFRKIDEIGLTRYACYLITQNTGSNRKAIAFAQAYFSIQSRKLAVIEQRLLDLESLTLPSKSGNKLSNIIYERGTDDKGFELIRTRRDEVVFGS
jgi:DNA-damage-inducible protein D